tara:strand:+ start:340 stop:525 length:186 start_codon:yes stop_codon:yes gene_type:complete
MKKFSLIDYAMRISMDTSIRPGALRKNHVETYLREFSNSKEEKEVLVVIDVPPENSKTDRN